MAKYTEIKQLRKKGKGRPKGSLNQDIDNIHDLLEPHRKALIDKAVKMAKAGNVAIMNKLLDKLLPNLNSVDLNSGKAGMPIIEINVRKVE